MSDRIRQSLAFVIAIGMVIAVAAVPTVAQTSGDVDRVLQVAGINADRVDGKHAVSYTTTKSKRAKKLVATNSSGMLPANIVKPKWSLISGVPAGFADGTDNKGVTKFQVTRVVGSSTSVSSGTYKVVSAVCPSGWVVTGGGYAGVGVANALLHGSTSKSDLSGWEVGVSNTGGGVFYASASAVCVKVTPTGLFQF